MLTLVNMLSKMLTLVTKVLSNSKCYIFVLVVFKILPMFILFSKLKLPIV